MTDTTHSTLMADTPHSTLMTDTTHSTLMTDTPHSTLTTTVPQSTLTQILQHNARFVCRAEYQAEINQHAEALKDCNTVLSLDSLCVAAYALRSRLTPPDDDDEEEEEKKEDRKEVELEGEDLGSDIPKTTFKRTAADKKADMLASAASDALAAFLVGGSSDLSYASAAEEASRESCRVGARKIFEGRRREETKVPVLKGDSAASNEMETEGGEKEEVADSAPPRAWLVQSFFASYEPLRVAFGLENTPPEDDIEEEDGEGDLNTIVQFMYKDQMEAAATAEKSQDSSSSDVNGSTSNGVEDDIDEGTKHPNTSLGLPAPPPHLSDNSYPLDSMAYWVLRRLVGRLEATREPGPEELAVVQANDEKLKSAGYTEVLGSWVGESQRMWEDLCAEEAEETAEEDCDTDVGEMKDEKELESIKLDAEYTSILQRLDLLGGEDSDKNIGYSLGLKMGGRGSLQGDKPVSVPSLSSQDGARNAAVSVSVAVQPVDVGEDFESDFAAFASSSDLLSHSDYTLSDPSSSSSSSTSASAGAATENVRRPVPRSAPPCPAFTWCLNLLRMPEVTAITGVTLSPIGAVVDIEGISPPSIQEEKAMKKRQKEREEKEEVESAAQKSRHSSYGKAPWMRQQEEDEDEEDGEDGDEDENWEDCDDDEEEEEEDNEEGQGDDDDEWEDCDEEECDDEDESPESSTVREEDEIAALRNSIRGVGMGWSAEGKKVNGKAPLKPVAAASSPAVDAAVKTTQSSATPNGTDTSAASDLLIAAEPDATHTPEVPLSSPTPVRDTSFPSSVSLSSPPLDRIVSSDTPISSDTLLTAPTSAPVPEISTPATTSPPLKVSRSLRARLLSVCSSIAYLSGDALGAVKCLRASVQENLTAGKEPPSMCPAQFIFFTFLFIANELCG
jgi:hypothetical protein